MLWSEDVCPSKTHMLKPTLKWQYQEEKPLEGDKVLRALPSWVGSVPQKVWGHAWRARSDRVVPWFQDAIAWDQKNKDRSGIQFWCWQTTVLRKLTAVLPSHIFKIPGGLVLKTTASLYSVNIGFFVFVFVCFSINYVPLIITLKSVTSVWE